MPNDSKYFYLGGFLSLFLSSSIIALILYALLHNAPVVKLQLNASHFVSVDLSQVKVTKPKKKQATRGAQVKKEAAVEKKPVVKKPEKVVKRVVDAAPVKKSLSDLFGKVKTKKIERSKNKQSQKAEAQSFDHIGKSLDSKKLKKSDSADLSSKTKNLLKDKKVLKATHKSVGIQDKYKAAIHDIVYDNYFPDDETVGLSATITIFLDRFGNITSSRIKGNISNSVLREAVMQCLQNIQNIKFPNNPDGQSFSIDVDLIVE